MTARPDTIAETSLTYWQEEAIHRFDAITQFVLSAWKSLMLVNGGAVIALITLLGNSHISVAGAKLWWGFIGYGLGIAATLFSMVAAYVCQSLYFQDAQRFHTFSQQTMAGLKVDAPSSAKWGPRWEFLGFTGAVAGLFGFVFGSAFAISAVLLPTSSASVQQASKVHASRDVPVRGSAMVPRR